MILGGLSWLLLMLTGIAAAQQSRDYAITTIDYTLADDRRSFTVSLTVTNQGATASNNTTVDVYQRLDEDDVQLLASDTLGPLASGDTVDLQFAFQTADFDPGSRQIIEVVVGVDDYELAGSPIADDNIRAVTVPIPQTIPPPQASPAADDPGSTPAPQSTDTDPLIRIDGDTVTVYGYELGRLEAAVILGAAAGLLLMLWLLTVIFRLAFRRPARYEVWQPPYALFPLGDPNSTEGRRQAWQGFAKNSLLLGASTEGNVHPVKRLKGSDDGNLNNWDVVAARLSQYDQYGRIERTAHVVEPKLIKRLNDIISRRDQTGQDKLQTQLSKVTERMIRGFRKTLSRDHAFLPVALDMRWQGTHGDVRIFFELYQCQGRAWYRIDRWEPTLSFIAETLQEEFTFTIHGRSPDETVDDFVQRLQSDVSWLLMETIRRDQPQQAREVPQDTFDVPDTLSGMAPVRDSQDEPA
jgi:PKD repeat protein